MKIFWRSILLRFETINLVLVSRKKQKLTTQALINNHYTFQIPSIKDYSSTNCEQKMPKDGKRTSQEKKKRKEKKRKGSTRKENERKKKIHRKYLHAPLN